MKKTKTEKNYLDDLKKTFSEAVTLYILKEKEAKTTAFGNEAFSKLSVNQCHYIEAIHILKGPTLSDLVRFFNVTNPTVSVTINRLIKMGFVMKTQSESDKRVFHILLTDKGKQIIEMEEKAKHAFVHMIREKLKEEEIIVLCSLLRKITED